MKKKQFLRTLFLIQMTAGLSFGAAAQLYTDASANLPDNGAKGQSMDLKAGDVDSDGDLDIILANEFQPNTILLNNGTGQFTNGTAGKLPQIVHDSEDIVFEDVNGDGKPDLLFCSEDDVNLGKTNVHEFYLGDGEGRFTTAAFQLPDSEANAIISGDIDGDGDPDILLGNNGINTVLINPGDGNFLIENNRLPAISRTTQDLALGDVDGDGDPDLIEGNENGNLLHINDGRGFFQNETTTRLPQGLNIETRKVSLGDADGDGDLDIFLSNVQFIQGKNMQNRLFINAGAGHFSDETAQRLPVDNDHTIDAIFEDVDLDGDLDIVLANVFGGSVKIYENDGAGKFRDRTMQILGRLYFIDALGVIAVDLNGDGYRDIYFCDRKSPQTNNKDLLLLRSPVSDVHELVADSRDFIIYPNPVRDEFYIKTGGENRPDTLVLEGTDGRTWKLTEAAPVAEGVYRLTIKNLKLANGHYFLNLNGKRKALVVMQP